jgi:hypothetical protein
MATDLEAAVLEMLDAAGGSVATRRATALGIILWRANALRHAADGGESPDPAAHPADLWSRALFAASDQGWIRRDRGRLVLTVAGRHAIETRAVQAQPEAREMLEHLAGLTAEELRGRVTPR